MYLLIVYILVNEGLKIKILIIVFIINIKKQFICFILMFCFVQIVCVILFFYYVYEIINILRYVSRVKKIKIKFIVKMVGIIG